MLSAETTSQRTEEKALGHFPRCPHEDVLMNKYIIGFKKSAVLSMAAQTGPAVGVRSTNMSRGPGRHGGEPAGLAGR